MYNNYGQTTDKYKNIKKHERLTTNKLFDFQ